MSDFSRALSLVNVKDNIPNAARIGIGVLLGGFGLFMLGGVFTGIGVNAAFFLLVIAGELVVTIGLVAYGLGLVAAAPASPWKLLPFLMAPVYFLSWGLDPGGFPAWVPEDFENWMAVAYGAGWVLLGILFPQESSR